MRPWWCTPAASGLGTAGIQLGKAAGARVIAVAGGPEKGALCASLGADVVIDHTADDFVEAVLADTGDRGADVVYDLAGGEFVERSWRCTARGGRYLAVGFADDDDNGMTGRPLRMACIGNIDIVGVMLAWVDEVDPGMRRFGFNPFGRDEADEIHADLLRLVAEGKHRALRRSAGHHGGGGRRARRPRGPPVAGTHGRARGRMTGPAADVDYTWRDSELRSPPLRALNRVGDGLTRMGFNLPSLTPASVVASAAKTAGSDDFGTDSFREPLEVFLDACATEADLTTFGRILVTKMLSQALANRIALHRWSLDHPEVLRGAHRQPLDHRRPAPHRDQRAVDAARARPDGPAPPAVGGRPSHPAADTGGGGRGSADRPDDQGARRVDEAQPAAQGDAPLRGHPGPGVRDACSCTTSAPWPSRPRPTCPRTPAGWRQAEMAPAYAQHRLALQTLQSRQPTERWILKTPNHLWHLEALLAAYPDARIIWTHRDPGPVVTSLASLANAGQRPLTHRSDPARRPRSGSASAGSPSTRRWPSTSARPTGGAGTSTTTP